MSLSLTTNPESNFKLKLPKIMKGEMTKEIAGDITGVIRKDIRINSTYRRPST